MEGIGEGRSVRAPIFCLAGDGGYIPSMPSIAIQKRPRTEEECVAAYTKFRRKTARGKVLKVLRETYHRDDIPCGSVACATCDASVYEAECAGTSMPMRHPVAYKYPSSTVIKPLMTSTSYRLQQHVKPHR